MSSPAPIPATCFSRLWLPSMLFGLSDDMTSMLLAQRFGLPFVRKCLQDCCQRDSDTATLAAESAVELNTEAHFLGGQVATFVVRLPAPRVADEAYFALFIIPARAEDGPKRYFTLEIAEPAVDGVATVVNEWAPDGEPMSFRRVEHLRGIQPDVPAFVAAIEQITGFVRDHRR